MKHLKSYGNINDTLKKYLLIHGENPRFGDHIPSTYTIIYKVVEHLPYGINATILYYTQYDIIQKSKSENTAILNNKRLNTEIIYTSDDLEDTIEKMKIYIDAKKFNI